MKEALDSFTVKSAEASFEENVKGRIAPGFLADFAVLDESPFGVKPAEIRNIKIRSVYLGGRKVYEA